MALRYSMGMRNRILGQKTTLITNGSFTSATTGWTASDATLTSEASGQDGNCLQIAETGGANPGKAYQDITTVIDRTYKCTFYFKKGTADFGRLMVGTTGDEDAIHDTGQLSDATWTLKTLWFTATAATTRITLQSDDATATETSLFDEVLVEEIFDGFNEIFREFKVAIYTGSQPTTADDLATGTLLVTISKDGGSDGLTWEEASSGAVSKTSTENAQGTAVATGVAGWMRCYEKDGDPATASTTEARFDGAIATSGAEMNMSNTSISSGAVQTISSFTYTQPAA